MQLMNIEWKWNIPNLLSLLRILLVPVFVILYLLSSDERMDLMYWSFGVLILSGVTDSLDGIIARKCNQITDLGKTKIADFVEQWQDMMKIYRPPQGKYSESNLKMASDMGYKTVFWSLAYVDWYESKQPTKQEAFNKLIPRIHPGAVVLLHSTSKTNGEILDELLTKWEEAGYTFKPITELA